VVFVPNAELEFFWWCANCNEDEYQGAYPMSRLYEAWMESKRVRLALNRDTDKARLWESWGINGIEIPPVQTAPEILYPREAEAEGEAEVSQEEEAPAVSNDFPGTSSDAAMDKKARLIPYATDASVVEHYRRLRTKILQIREEKPFRTLLVTSASPQEGKTVTVLNVGLSLAMLPSFKVLVVDGDLRRGSLGNWLGVPANQPGLSNLVDGSARLEDVVLKSASIPMHFMVRGNSRVADMTSAQFDVHFRRLAECFDLVIVDSPPVNLLADVQLLAGSCEAVLLVARSFVTSRQALDKAVQDLQSFRVIGTVLNASTTERRRTYNGYY
jgi:capsular exopolysaccharide synthesis family protein